jgi:hypothetical protein
MGARLTKSRRRPAGAPGVAPAEEVTVLGLGGYGDLSEAPTWPAWPP